MIDIRPIRKRFIDSPQDIQVQADWRWEYKIVSHLLTSLDLASARYQLLGMQEESTGQSRLTLNCFHCLFPAFPVYLVSQALYKVDQDVKVARLFTRFDKTRLYKAWEDNIERVPERFEDYSYGLVVQWPYVKNGFILHDATVDLHDRGMRLVFCQEDRRLVLESFDAFLANLPPIEFDRG